MSHGQIFQIVIYLPESPLLQLASLRLFIPPLRLVCAAMWQVVHRGNVQDYGMVEEFISTVSEIVPDLVNPEQKTQLLLGLRARVCKSDFAVFCKNISILQIFGCRNKVRRPIVVQHSCLLDCVITARFTTSRG